MRRVYFALAMIVAIGLSPIISLSQLVSSNPAFPYDNQSVVITFDASEGSGGLAGFTGDVYAHTGVITNESTSPSDWKYVVSNWGENTAATKLTSLGGDLYELAIGPNIRDYYSVPAGETILQIALVFRSADPVGGSYLEGKTASGGDIYVDVYTPGLNIQIVNPSESMIVELNENINIEAEGILCDSMALYINDNLISKVEGTQLSQNISASGYGKFWVKALAWNTTDVVADSIYFYVRPQVVVEDLPAGMESGINYIDANTVLLALYAPFKDYAFAIGDFSNWEVGDENYMKKTTDGKTYWVKLENLEAGKEYIYQYFIDGEITIADPYTEKVSDPWNDHYIPNESYPDLIDYPIGNTQYIASVFQTNQVEYTWNNPTWNRPAKEDLIVYELLIRDFTAKQNVQTLIDTLGYLEFLGINTIELMPVNEFEGNNSWGYNPDFYFAFDKYYGPKNEFKRFVDECHSRGIAVVMDIALNHSFGLSPLVQLYWDAANNQPAANNPWYNQQPMHDYNVGFDFNHESNDTKDFFKRVVKFWIDEFKIDGYRFDLSKGFTQNNTLGNTAAWGYYDASRVSIWKNYADFIWSVDSETYVIMEHFADNSEETELANYGMMFWGNMNYNYTEAAMGYPSNDLSWGYYQSRGWNNPNLITYMESHDEERMMYKNISYGNSSGSYDITNTNTALKRAELSANFFLPIPGPKMIWQFGEQGYDISIDFNGRTGEKPVKWDYYSEVNRNHLFNVYRALIDLKKNEPAFSEGTFSMQLNSYLKRINITHATMSVAVLGNFDVTSGSISPNFAFPGKWYEFYTGDSITVSDVNAQLSLNAGEYRLYTSRKLETPIFNTVPVAVPSILSTQTGNSVYPNPSRNSFTIKVEGRSAQVEIYNSVGQMVQKMNVADADGTRYLKWNARNFNGQEVPAGIYFCRIINGDSRETIKLIKQ